MPRRKSHQATALEERLNYDLPKIKLCLVSEPTKRNKPVSILSPRDAVKLMGPLRFASEEHFISLHLNSKNEVLGVHEVSHGTLSSSLVHPREVFKAALMANSFAIIVCHNHPSGSKITPSQEDLETTKQLLKAGSLVGVAVIDHLIVGPTHSFDDAYSIRESHPEIWSKTRCVCT